MKTVLRMLSMPLELKGAQFTVAGVPVVLAFGADPFGPGWGAADYGWAFLGGGFCIPIALASN